MTRPERSGHDDGRADAQMLLLTREQAAALCQVSLDVLDQWSYLPGFPVIRRSGGHFVRIHRAALEDWLRAFATQEETPARPPTAAGVASIRQARRGSGRA